MTIHWQARRPGLHKGDNGYKATKVDGFWFFSYPGCTFPNGPFDTLKELKADAERHYASGLGERGRAHR